MTFIISNTIYDLQLNQETGELYIITDKGLVSYRTNASYEDPEYSESGDDADDRHPDTISAKRSATGKGGNNTIALTVNKTALKHYNETGHVASYINVPPPEAD